MSSTARAPDQDHHLRVELHTALLRHADAVVDGMVAELRGPGGQRRWGVDVRQHAGRLMQAFLGALLEGIPQNFIAYIERLGGPPGDTGSDTRNLWMALTLLEDRIWSIVVREVSPEHQVKLLGWVTRTIGTTKDRLAGMLVEGSPRAGFEQTLSLLSHGTDPAPEDGEQDLAAVAG